MNLIITDNIKKKLSNIISKIINGTISVVLQTLLASGMWIALLGAALSYYFFFMFELPQRMMWGIGSLTITVIGCVLMWLVARFGRNRI